MISSNSASSAAIGSVTGGSADLQAPQRPVLARNFAGIRFFCPQFVQARITGINTSPLALASGPYGCSTAAPRLGTIDPYLKPAPKIRCRENSKGISHRGKQKTRKRSYAATAAKTSQQQIENLKSPLPLLCCRMPALRIDHPERTRHRKTQPARNSRQARLDLVAIRKIDLR